jgi:diguanylate cyclase (GGDEF)-like protein/PAS domain S-box-containing protein
MASPTVRILFAEDVADDAELEVRELKRAGLRVVHRVVADEEAFTAALRDFAPDVIISDFSMPGFDGMHALSIATEIAPHTPFIFVSGTIGEEYAIRAVKSGAWDYVLKTNLVRLPPAVERALAEAAVRRERLRTEVELELAQERLREREAALARAQLMAKLSHVITRPDGSFDSWSQTLPNLLGVRSDQLVTSTRRWLELVHPDDRALFRETALAARAGGKRADVEYRLRRHDGAWIHVRQVMEPIPGQEDAQGRMRWFNTLQDVTDQKAAEARIRRLNRVYAVLSGINGLIVRVRDREELYREACRIAVEAGNLRFAWIGVVDREAMQLRPAAWAGDERDFLAAVGSRLSLSENDSQGSSLVARAALAEEAMISNDVANDPRIAFKQEHAERGIRSLAAFPLIVSERVVGVFALHATELGFFDDDELRLLSELAGDISFALDHIGKEEKLDYLAYYDSLTGLANRTFFQERLEQYVHEASRAQRKLAVIVVDIERFRTINDTLGRRGGDALLKQMAARLLGEAGGPREVARLGADHFAVVIPEVKAEEDLVRIIENARRRILAQPFAVEGNELRVSTKAGIALFPNDAAGAETLLRNAEAALAKAKGSGERHLFYTEQMTERVAEKLTLENKLRQALEKAEFVLHYQPKINLETRSIVGVEALIRWQSPELGLVPPMKFIPLLEETGLILEVGAWALNRAALDHRGWVEERLEAPRVAVNVSAIQLRQRDFVATLEQAIIGGAAPVGIDLEITESLIMEDIQATIEKLKNARGLGVNIAIDDFGTGYSSLAYLAKLPVGSLKIDRSFIITMLSDPNTMTLVSTIISLAHSLELKVVAEGVDAEEQARALRLLRCDEMQGYLYSKPLPMKEMVALLRKRG